MSQKTINITFFFDCSTQKFSLLKSQSGSTPWTVFLTQAYTGKPMFSPFVNNFWTKTDFSTNITNSSVNFTLFVLYSLHNGLALLHKYTPMRALDEVHQSVLVHLSNCWVTLRLAVLCAAQFWLGVPFHWTYLWPQGAVLQVLTLFRGVRFITWRLRCPSLGECQWGLRYF